MCYVRVMKVLDLQSGDLDIQSIVVRQSSVRRWPCWGRLCVLRHINMV